MGAALGIAGTLVSAVGTIAGGAAANQAGQYQANALQFQAKQYELQASDARASGQRSDFEKRREGRFAESALTARAAAGGGSATDPTALHLVGDIAGRSEFLALTEGFKGENKARGFEDAAAGARYSAGAAIAGGQAAQTASYIGAGGTILSGLGSAYSQNKGLPAATSPLALNTPLSVNPLNYRNKYAVG